MPLISEDFKERLKRESPTPPDESEEFTRVTGHIVLGIIVFAAVVSYIATGFFSAQLDVISTRLASLVPLLRPRITFLAAVDPSFPAQYAAGVISFVLVQPIGIAIFARAYWRTVVKKRLCKPVGPVTPITMLLGAGLLLVFVWATFGTVPSRWDPRYPGMARIFFHPIYQILASLISSLSAFLSFAILVGFLKFLFLRRGHK